MIFGQLIKVWHEKYICLENNRENAMEILFPDSFLKHQNWAYLRINILKIHTACFSGMPSLGLSEHIETKAEDYLLLPQIKHF